SNFAEAHPVGFRFVMEAKERGAKIIHVDPRFTRTSAVADLYIPMRSGTDVVFLGGIINWLIANDRYFKEYVVNYTNASSIVSDDFQDTEDLDGLFSGWSDDNAAGGYVDTASGAEAHEGGAEAQSVCTYDTKSWQFQREENGALKRDLTLQHPKSVFQILK